MDNTGVGGKDVRTANAGNVFDEFGGDIRSFGEAEEMNQAETTQKRAGQIENGQTGASQGEASRDGAIQGEASQNGASQGEMGRALGNSTMRMEGVASGSQAEGAPGASQAEGTSGTAQAEGIFSAPPAPNLTEVNTSEGFNAKPLAADGSTEKNWRKHFRLFDGDLINKDQEDQIREEVDKAENRGDLYEIDNIRNRWMVKEDRDERGLIFGDDGNESFYTENDEVTPGTDSNGGNIVSVASNNQGGSMAA